MFATDEIYTQVKEYVMRFATEIKIRLFPPHALVEKFSGAR